MQKVLSKDEQRARADRLLRAEVGLNSHLRNLIREISAGRMEMLTEFQQMVQYAPPALKVEMLDLL